MTLEEAIDESITKILELNPDLTYAEVYELCSDYLLKFNKPTKEETKIKSLKKYLGKFFEIDLFADEEPKLEDIQPSMSPLQSIPKQYFQERSRAKKDYIIKIHHLDKQIWKTILFDDANLQLRFGDEVALIWKNGSGKSTLLKMLIWKEESGFWMIEIADWVKIWYLSQDLFWANDEHTVEEEMKTCFPDIKLAMERLEEIEKLLNSNCPPFWKEEDHEVVEDFKILSPSDSSPNREQNFSPLWGGVSQSDEGVVIQKDYHSLLEERDRIQEWLRKENGYQKRWMQIEILKYFWFSKSMLNFKIKQLSWWEQTKLQIAKFLIQEVDLLLLDEPTNHLDIEWIFFLQRFCELWWKTLICISHDKKFLNSCFNRVVEISQKKLHLYEWNYSDYLHQKEKNLEIQHKNYVAQQKYLQQQEKFITKFRYKSSKAAQVQSRIKMLDKLERVEAPETESDPKKINFRLSQRLPNLIMQIEWLTVWYPWKELVTLPNKIEITKEMHIWIIWENWIWKTTLVKTILGQISPLHWSVKVHPDLRIGSYSQVFDDLHPDDTVIEAVMWVWISYQDARAFLWTLKIDVEKMDHKVSSLSWWEMAKVAVTKMLLQKPHIIIMDEPTNHLDLGSKETIKMMLEWFNWVTLIVSHDRDFLEWTSNMLWWIWDNHLTVFHDLQRWFQELESSCWKW